MPNMPEMNCPNCGHAIKYWDTNIDGKGNVTEGVIIMHWECENCHTMGDDTFYLVFQERQSY